ncbi:MAG TPA: AMP-binding protein, partial [Polyangiaceae bacterium]|nr:AMP-binding protein [Polyangiaceae bacterium]
MQSQRGGRELIVIGAELARGLGALARGAGATPFMGLVAALKALLHRYSGQTDLALGTPVAGRSRPELEPLVGCFVNTLVLRTDLAGDPGFRALLGRVREVTLGALAHQEAPFEKVVDTLAVPRDLSHTPLFQAMLVLHNTPAPVVRLPGLVLRGADVDTGAAKLDLTLELRETPGGGFEGTWEYNADLFDAATVAQLSRHFVRLLGAALAAPERPLSELPLLDEAEAQELLAAGAASAAAPPRDGRLRDATIGQAAAGERSGGATANAAAPGERLHDATIGQAAPQERLSDATIAPAPAWAGAATLAEAFEAQARLRPDAVALRSEGEGALSYRELDARAERLARRLRAAGVGPEARVAVMVARPVETVVAFLGVLKAGGAYAPLDPAQPAERVAAMLATLGPVATLASRGQPAPGGAGVKSLAFDDDGEPGEPGGARPAVGGGHAAYVIFTSGSGGRPKGVVVEHRSVLASTAARAAAYGEAGRCLSLPPFTFDASAAGLYWALLGGGTLCFPSPATREDPRALAGFVAAEGVTRLVAVPAAYEALL